MQVKQVAVLLCAASLFLGSAALSAEEIRVLLANHPYGELLKSAMPDFEKISGIKVNVESLQESQLSAKLIAEFATKASSVDVFMTRPLQDGKMFHKNGWYEDLSTYDFSDYPKNVMSVVSFLGKPQIVPLVTEWQVLFYRKDLLEKAGLKVPTTLTELENAAKILHSSEVAGIASRGNSGAAVTQLSSYLYNFGGRYLDRGRAVFDNKPSLEAFRFYGRLLGAYGPKGITSMSWENIMPLMQAGKVAMWTDASVFYGQMTDPSKTNLPTGSIAIAPFPKGQKVDAPFLITSWGMSVAKQSKKKDLAMKFLTWATSKELAVKGMIANITMARSSVWAEEVVLAKIHPGLVATRAHAAQNGTPTDRPHMSAVGEARSQIGELIVEAINTKGESPRLEAMAKDKAKRVDELLKETGEYGK